MAKNKKRADGRYSCQVYLGKGPDGKRKYKTFYGSTLREAKAAADDFRSAVSKGMDPEQAEATLGTLYDNLIAAKKAKGIGQKSIDRLATNKAHWGELVDVMTARDQMGHKDISVTLGIYTALDKKFKKKKINRLDTYLKKSCTKSG